MNEHTGHRQRMRERFLRYGLDNFADHNALELLLSYAMPRKDTNPLAHRLLDTFGGLDGVFDASAQALLEVDGVGENTVALLRLMPELFRRYLIVKNSHSAILADSDAAGRYLLPRFFNCSTEVLYIVCMDAKMKVLDCRPVCQGDTVSVAVNIAQIVRIALGQNASAVLLAHNHTSGIALPSNEDVDVTMRIRDVLAQVGVTLTDHIVVAGDDFVSMADSGLLPSQ